MSEQLRAPLWLTFGRIKALIAGDLYYYIYDLDKAAGLVAGVGEHRLTATRLESAAHHRLGESDEERYSQGDRNRRADGCGRANVGRGIGRRDTGS